MEAVKIMMKILVVDDSDKMRKTIRKELAGEGYDVAGAEDGEKALQQIANNIQPDLIILDVEMPGLDGFGTCVKLQDKSYSRFLSHRKDCRVPVLFVTENDNLEYRKRGFELGAIDFIAKPFVKGELLAEVKKILLQDDHLKGLTALVVDKCLETRRMISEILERRGLNTIEAKNTGLGFKIMCDHRQDIDILITDLMMPGMKGAQLCRKIRRELNLIDIPIIFLTDMAETSQLLGLFRSGGTDYIVKPFVSEEFLARITVHLESAQLTKRFRETARSLSRANKEVWKLSLTDPLTGCYNRGYMTAWLPREVERSKRYGHAFAIIIGDIDRFKTINDEHGHQAGDQVLKAFVQTIMKEMRNHVDWLARYGDKEFMVVLPETGVTGANRLAKRLRNAVSSKKIKIQGKEVQITASFGGIAVEKGKVSKEITLEILINRAETILSQAKKDGTNMVKIESLSA